MNSFIQFAKDWQELIGAFLGPFLAVVFSVIGFFITKLFAEWRRQKETFRKIEVHTTYALNSTMVMQKKLGFFVKSAKELVGDIRSMDNPKEFALQTTNFPPLGEIHLFTEAPDIRIQSYFLHNKLLWAHSGTVDVNNILNELSSGWFNIINMNNRLIDLMKDKPNPVVARKQYADNIEIFYKEIERFTKEDLSEGLKVLAQIKVYNEILRQPYLKGKFNWWKYEGLSFKYFKNSAEFKQFSNTLESVDRIDKNIQSKVDQLMLVVQKRDNEISNDKRV